MYKNYIKKLLQVILFISGVLVFLTGLYIDRVFTFEILDGLSTKNVPVNLNKIKSTTPLLFTVYSGSMEPAIKTASVIVSKPQSNYVQGDIVTFTPTSSMGNVVTHRIVAKENVNSPVYKTAGDANQTIDPWTIDNSQIKGKVVLTVPLAGYVTNFAKTPSGFILLIIVPATIVIYEEIKSLLVAFVNEFKKRFFKSKKLNPIYMSNFTIKKSSSILLPFVFLTVLLTSAVATYSVLSDREVNVGNTFSVNTQGQLEDSLEALPTSTFATENSLGENLD
ncbi:signal peptidase I [Candidatus Woesebacteria bacterium]|nr:MAG: signal peptidase I [Candidatus Woesebacteria bacterium]